MNSFNHYAYGAIGEWMYRYVAGIDCASDSVAWDKIVLRPDLSAHAFKHAAAHYDSVRGRIAIAWNINRDQCELEVTLPGNTQAVLLLPKGDKVTISENNSQHDWQQQLGQGQISLGSGSYRFIIKGLPTQFNHEQLHSEQELG